MPVRRHGFLIFVVFLVSLMMTASSVLPERHPAAPAAGPSSLVLTAEPHSGAHASLGDLTAVVDVEEHYELAGAEDGVRDLDGALVCDRAEHRHATVGSHSGFDVVLDAADGSGLGGES